MSIPILIGLVAAGLVYLVARGTGQRAAAAGYRTSEFALVLAVLAAALAAIYAANRPGGPVSPETMAWMRETVDGLVNTGIAYVVGRSGIKAAGEWRRPAAADE